MKKTILISAVLMALALSTQARGGIFDFGVKGGVTTPRINFSNTAKYDNYGLSSSNRGGYHLGMVSRINLPMLHIQPEILFSNTGYRLSGTIIQGGNSESSKSIVRVRNLDVPVLVGMRMMWLRLQAGPMFTVMTDTNTKDKGVIREVTVTMPSVSYLLGVGVDIRRFSFDVRFNGNFAKTTQDIVFRTNDPAQTYKSKNKYWTFSVGYMF
ncbi:MAG: PorT family protein [Rikenellaceae bacterium]|nr:PorT family protein [Rikenellaceae bacterium]